MKAVFSIGLIVFYLVCSAVFPVLALRQECTVPATEKNGICISLEHDVAHCPGVRDSLLEKNFTGVYSVICGEPDLHRLNETLVCCPVEDFLKPYPTQVSSLEGHKNFKLLPNPKDLACGRPLVSSTDRIIGGEAVAPGGQPWMVRLGMQLPDDDQVRFPCSGSLINEKYILTAAHCLKHGELKFLRLAETDEDIKSECIMTGINSTMCQEFEDIEPNKIMVHENYSGKIGSPNDIALIRLNLPIRNISSPFTRPICLPFQYDLDLPDLENKILTSSGAKNFVSVSGWGKENNKDNSGSTQLKQVLVPLRSNALCEYEFKKANLTITDEQICVGGSKNKGSCAGDSGSPLVANGNIVDKRIGTTFFQIGIVSYGNKKCGLVNSPVVYTRVRSFLTWILDNMEP